MQLYTCFGICHRATLLTIYMQATFDLPKCLVSSVMIFYSHHLQSFFVPMFISCLDHSPCPRVYPVSCSAWPLLCACDHMSVTWNRCRGSYMYTCNCMLVCAPVQLLDDEPSEKLDSYHCSSCSGPGLHGSECRDSVGQLVESRR